MTYDSRVDTLEHIEHVRTYLDQITQDLELRADHHDASKLKEPEKSTFDRVTQRLAAIEYGTPEYQECLADMGPALQHHYEHNDHHPEHHEHGVRDMDLMQLTEMLADWKAATLRHKDGDLRRSIHDNAARFGYGPDIERLLTLTADRLGWL